MFLLRRGGPVGVREVQRGLGMSSPSVALHHLEKLERLGIVSKDKYGRYLVSKRVDVGVLYAFVNIGRLLLPRLGFYASFFTTLAVAYLVKNLHNLDIYALTVILGSVVVFWYETIRSWRRKPF